MDRHRRTRCFSMTLALFRSLQECKALCGNNCPTCEAKYSGALPGIVQNMRWDSMQIRLCNCKTFRSASNCLLSASQEHLPIYSSVEEAEKEGVPLPRESKILVIVQALARIKSKDRVLATFSKSLTCRLRHSRRLWQTLPKHYPSRTQDAWPHRVVSAPGQRLSHGSHRRFEIAQLARVRRYH